MKINACIEKHLAEQYQLNSGKYAEKLKHIADKNFQTNCNKNDAAENIRLVGKPGSEAFSRESPVMQIKNVTMAMIREQTRAISQSYSEMVNPTDRASMEVAMP